MHQSWSSGTFWSGLVCTWPGWVDSWGHWKSLEPEFLHNHLSWPRNQSPIGHCSLFHQSNQRQCCKGTRQSCQSAGLVGVLCGHWYWVSSLSAFPSQVLLAISHLEPVQISDNHITLNAIQHQLRMDNSWPWHPFCTNNCINSISLEHGTGKLVISV